MIGIRIGINPQFCNKCGTKCYLTFKEDGFQDGEMTYKIMKNCPHAGFFNFRSHDQSFIIDYGEAEE